MSSQALKVEDQLIVDNVDYLPTQLNLKKIEEIENHCLQEEQVDCPVIHRFAPSIYIREVTLPAGAFAIGHFQKTEHLNVMLAGRVTMIGEDGEWTEVTAPKTFVSKPGRKIGFIHETVIWQNIYSTDETDVEKLEEMFLEKSITWKENKEAEDLFLTFDGSGDIKDYYEAIKEFGFDHATVQEQTLNEEDQAPFPHGGYSVMVSKSRIDGKGMFATAGFDKGQVIAPARLEGKRTPAGRYVNHAKNPNCYFVMDENEDIYLMAGKEISGCQGGNLGDELTVDYRQALNLQTGEKLCQA